MAYIEILVFDQTYSELSEAKVLLQNLRSRQRRELSFDSHIKRFSANIQNGDYTLTVSYPNLETYSRQIKIDNSVYKENVILFTKGMKYYYDGKTRVPYEERPGLVGVSVNLQKKQSGYNFTKEIYNLFMNNYIVHSRINNIYIVESKTKKLQINNFIKNVVQKEKLKGTIRLIGPIVKLTENEISFLTRQIIIKFKEDQTEDERIHILKKYNLEKVRDLKYLKNTYLCSHQSSQPTYKLLDIIRDMVESDSVESAEPNLVSSIKNLSTVSINEIDRWSYDLVKIKAARDLLVERGKSNLQYGSSSIVIAIMDTGVPSVTDENGNVKAKHPAFNGTIDGDTSKITNFFDFVNYVANNDACTNKHGIACAGIASASKLNDNPFSVVPNCRIMALRYPENGTRINFADAYLWVAGFDPQIVIDQCNYMDGEVLPPPPNPPADIISNSYQYPFRASSCISDVLSYIGEYGRNNKGTLLFVAAGNDDENMANSDVNFLALHPYSFTISASTFDRNGNEKRAGYSNYGKKVFACAPSDNRQSRRPDPVHNPPNRYAISTCDENDYRNNFGGTSASAPLVAGIAGLVLSVRPELTRDQIREILKRSCEKIDSNPYEVTFQWYIEGGFEFSQAYGYGRINALLAIRNILGPPN